MARLPRLVIPFQPHHIAQFSVDRQAVFRDTADYQAFLDWLREAARQYHVAIHAYVLMPDHVHILGTPDDAEGLARMMQWVGRHYVPYFNRKYSRAGTLWQGRFKTTVIEPSNYLMLCTRYIEQNPVHTGLVGDAFDYVWSSYAHHIGGKPDPLITDHPIYWALGNTPFEREAAYKQLAEQALTSDELTSLEKGMRKGWVLGTDAFKSALERQWNRPVKPEKRGRPKKVKDIASGEESGVAT